MIPPARSSRSRFGFLTAIEWLLRLMLGGVFVWAGWLKSRDPVVFLEDIRSFQILPDPYAAWLAMGLPWLEIFAGIAVLTGILGGGGLTVLAGSLLVFLGALLYSWQRGLDITCGCFGKSENDTTYPELVGRDLVLLAAAVWLWWRWWFRWSRKREPAAGPADPPEEA